MSQCLQRELSRHAHAVLEEMEPRSGVLCNARNARVHVDDGADTRQYTLQAPTEQRLGIGVWNSRRHVHVRVDHQRAADCGDGVLVKTISVRDRRSIHDRIGWYVHDLLDHHLNMHQLMVGWDGRVWRWRRGRRRLSRTRRLSWRRMARQPRIPRGHGRLWSRRRRWSRWRPRGGWRPRGMRRRQPWRWRWRFVCHHIRRCRRRRLSCPASLQRYNRTEYDYGYDSRYGAIDPCRKTITSLPLFLLVSKLVVYVWLPYACTRSRIPRLASTAAQ